MISLMQEDTRKAKEHGAENLTIGYFVMKVTLLKQLSIIWVTSFHFWLCKPYLSEFVCFQSNICHFAVCLNAYQSLSSWRLSVDFFCHNVCLCVFDCYTTTYMCMSVSLCDHNWCAFTICVSVSVFLFVCVFLCLSAFLVSSLSHFSGLRFDYPVLFSLVGLCVFTSLSDCLSVWYRSTFTYVCSVLSRLVIFCPFLPALSLIVSPLGGREQKVSVTYDVWKSWRFYFHQRTRSGEQVSL